MNKRQIVLSPINIIKRNEIRIVVRVASNIGTSDTNEPLVIL